MRSMRLAVFLTLAACAAPSAGHAAEIQATVDNFSFSPPRLAVHAGDRVTWTNRDDIPHTVTDAKDPGGTRSPPLDTGDSYTRPFPKPGTYKYFCSLHPHMQGIVVVR